MELSNEFSVSVPIDEAWAALTDLARIAPCMPGFELVEVEGDEYRGVVKVKVGPMTAQYKGAASFRERDGANYRAVVRAEGRETRGQGNASATVTATLVPERGGTRVTVHTVLSITGKVAQFGRGVLADVSSKLLGQFVQALEADLRISAARAGASEIPENAATAADGSVSSSGRGMQGGSHAESIAAATTDPRRIDTGGPIDLLATAGSSVIERLGPLAAALAAVVAVVIWLLLRR